MNTIKTLFATLASAGLLTTAASAQAAADAATGTTGAQTSTTTTAATTEVRTDAAKPTGDDVGISSRDGIVLSGTAVLVTRNGVSETLQKEIVLDNGTRVAPNGTVTPQGGAGFTLRPTQILMFDGRLVNATTGSAGATGTGVGTATTTTATTAVPVPATSTTTTTVGTEQTGAAAADAEAARRANSTKQ
jgi:hypothetical protein